MARRTPIDIIIKRIRLREPWRRLPNATWGDPFKLLDSAGDLLEPPFPQLWIGCGRLAVPFTIAVKRNGPATFTIELQNPRAPASLFDLVIPPQHDGLDGDNVFPIVGSPARRAVMPDTQLAAAIRQSGSTVAVLIGGPNRAFRLTESDAEEIADKLLALNASLLVTTSQRTPADVAETLRQRLDDKTRTFWRSGIDAPEANPYPAMLQGVDAILVTEDSVNMAVEAASTGRPVYILPLRLKPFASADKFKRFHESLRERGAARLFEGKLERWTYEPLRETDRAADEAVRRWQSSRPRVR